MSGVLEGVLVLDLTRYLSGPHCTLLLAGLGADRPHLRARDMVRPLKQPDGRETQVVAAGFPLKFSRSVAGHDSPAPAPGSDTADVLARRLGVDAQQLAALRRDGVV